MRYGSNIVIIDKANRILLQQRDNISTVSGAGGWALWGGSQEEGETPIMCAQRELKEETGLEVCEKDLEFVAKLRDFSNRGTELEISMYRYYLKDTDKINLGEGEGYGFFRKNEIMHLPMGSSGVTKKLWLAFLEKFQ